MVNNTARVLLVVFIIFAMGFKGKLSTISDTEVAAAIKQRLAMDGRIDPTAVQVKVQDGNVTLQGTVRTIAEKALADHLVASTYGVKSLTNELVVHPVATKDGAIKRAVEETLKSTPALQKTDVQVTVSQGVVTLKGAVEKPAQSMAAERAAKTVPGAVEVVNLIKVVGPPRPDRDIEKDVVFYLQSSSLVNLDEVDYAVTNGMVTLKGKIDNLSHKFAIANDLEKIHGVRGVDVSGLTVKTS